MILIRCVTFLTCLCHLKFFCKKLLVEHKESFLCNTLRSFTFTGKPDSAVMFSVPLLLHPPQEKLIESLSRKINQVYRVCIGDAEVGSLNPVQKLVKVESRLVELSDLIESIPKENVEAIERIKQKERRQKYGPCVRIKAKGSFYRLGEWALGLSTTTA